PRCRRHAQLPGAGGHGRGRHLAHWRAPQAMAMAILRHGGGWRSSGQGHGGAAIGRRATRCGVSGFVGRKQRISAPGGRQNRPAGASFLLQCGAAGHLGGLDALRPQAAARHRMGLVAAGRRVHARGAVLGYFIFGDKVKFSVYPGIALLLLGVGLNVWYTSRQEAKEKPTD
nr:hypothetical protein [Tanacetum cinerariifolium]